MRFGKTGKKRASRWETSWKQLARGRRGVELQRNRLERGALGRSRRPAGGGRNCRLVATASAGSPGNPTATPRAREPGGAHRRRRSAGNPRGAFGGLEPRAETPRNG